MQMAQQGEPLYDFPEPTQTSQRHQRGQGSLRSISALDRLLLTVPVWLQLSINAATALHILRREPPGTFLIRKSRTSQRNVLCVRLADDSVPSFVQQFGIKEEPTTKTLYLETSAIRFPDLPRLISFYCASKDVLPFPLELPGAIARASSHKELESISHMGIEFWNSHLNIRGPRETSKPQKEEEQKPDAAPAVPAANPLLTSGAEPCLDNNSVTASKPDPVPTLFHEFCPISTRSPRELDCGPGLGALCFINPLFLQCQNSPSRHRMFKRSLKVRVSSETSTLLSPPLASPPPPPLMPKTKGRCKAKKAHSQAPVPPASSVLHLQPEIQTQVEPGQRTAGVEEEKFGAELPTAMMTLLPIDSDYMSPSALGRSQCPSLSPYMSPSVSPKVSYLSPKVSPFPSPLNSPLASPSLSPYQSPSLSPRIPFPLSPFDSNLSCSSTEQSPSLSPVQSSSPSPVTNLAFFAPMSGPACNVYDIPVTLKEKNAKREVEETCKEKTGDNGHPRDDSQRKKDSEEEEEEDQNLALQMNAASLKDTHECSHLHKDETG
ncbi:ras and Rab interactor 1-like [Gouania willdenowi]|uniref:Ras and Rab interactor 1-like n=1 Tax=Gouania willdenowi TaxID=441366 RepID=A0A8C5DXJ5_GOUWI|nr:ras and Rab interactor 1-like [Gouania willdenowi]XP_028322360.1 ras and Rab interactor 1-like [Gouania willdenowi]